MRKHRGFQSRKSVRKSDDIVNRQDPVPRCKSERNRRNRTEKQNNFLNFSLLFFFFIKPVTCNFEHPVTHTYNTRFYVCARMYYNIYTATIYYYYYAYQVYRQRPRLGQPHSFVLDRTHTHAVILHTHLQLVRVLHIRTHKNLSAQPPSLINAMKTCWPRQ